MARNKYGIIDLGEIKLQLGIVLGNANEEDITAQLSDVQKELIAHILTTDETKLVYADIHIQDHDDIRVRYKGLLYIGVESSNTILCFNVVIAENDTSSNCFFRYDGDFYIYSI